MRHSVSHGPTSISGEGRLTIRQALHRVDGQLRLDPVKTDASIAVLPIPDPAGDHFERATANDSSKNGLQPVRAGATRGWSSRLPMAASSNRGTRIEFSIIFAGKQTSPSYASTIFATRAPTLLFTMGVSPATVQRILRHSSITVTTGTYVEVIEAVQRDALDSMGSLFAHVAMFDEPASSKTGPLSSKLSSNGSE